MNAYGPWKIEVIIYVTDGEQIAKVTFDLGAGDGANGLSAYDRAAKLSLQQVNEQLGVDWRLCTPQEYWRERVREQTGESVAVAVPNEWDERE